MPKTTIKPSAKSPVKRAVRSTIKKKPAQWKQPRSFYRRWQFAAVMLVVVGVGLAIPFIISKAATVGGPITASNGKCLDNVDAVRADQNPVRTATCAGYVRQTFTWTGDGTLRVQDHCLYSSKVMPSGYSSSASLLSGRIYTCNGVDTTYWKLDSSGRIINQANGLCLDSNGVTSADTDLTVRTCSTTATQKWNLTAAVLPLTGTAAPHAAKPTYVGKRFAPTIKVDAAEAPEFSKYLTEQVVPILRDWYPYIADQLLDQSIPSPANFTIVVDKDKANGMNAASGVIYVSADAYRTRLPELPGTLMHEATHLMQSQAISNPSTWFNEGVADYPLYYLYQDRTAPPFKDTESFITGYHVTSRLLKYIDSYYSPGFTKYAFSAAYNGDYSNDVFKQRTGKSTAQLWYEMTGKPASDLSRFSNLGNGKCMDLTNGSNANGTIIQSLVCYGNGDSQQWMFSSVGTSKTDYNLRSANGVNSCVEPRNGATANGTPVWYQQCNMSANQVWYKNASGFIIHKSSGKCLQPASSADYAQLIITTCGGSAYQQWNLPLIYN